MLCTGSYSQKTWHKIFWLYARQTVAFFFFFFSHNASKVNLLELLPLCLLVCLNLPDVGGNGGKGGKGFHFVCTFITIISNGHSNNSQ